MVERSIPADKTDQYQPSEQLLAFLKEQQGFLSEARPLQEESKDGFDYEIGYGHKFKADDHLRHERISEQEATQILLADLNKAHSDARNVFDHKFGNGEFAQLNQYKQDMLTEFAYNLGAGGLQKYAKFMTAVRENDLETAMAECLRNFLDQKDGQYKPLERRNKAFIETFFNGGLFREGHQVQRNSQQVPFSDNSWRYQFSNPAHGSMTYEKYDQELIDKLSQVAFNKISNSSEQAGISKIRDQQLIDQFNQQNDIARSILLEEERLQEIIEKQIIQEEFKMEEIQADINQIESKMEEYKKTEEALNLQMGEKKLQKEQTKNELQKLQEDVKILQDEREKLENEERQHQQNLDKAVKDKAKTIEMNKEDKNKLDDIQEDLTKAREEISELKLKIQKLDQEIDNQNKEIVRLQKEKYKLERQFKNQEEEKNIQEQEEITHARNEENLSNKLKQLQQNLNIKKILVNAAKILITGVASVVLNGILVAAGAVLGPVEFQFAQQCMNQNSYQGVDAEIEEVKRQLEEEKRKKIACGQQIKKLSEDIKTTKNNLEDKQQDLKDANESMSKNESKKKEISAEDQAAKSKEKNLRDEMKSLTYKITENDEKLQSFENEINETKNQIDKKAALIEQEKKNIEMKNKKVQNLREDLHILEEKFNKVQREQQKLENQKNSLQKDMDEIIERRVKHEHTKEGLKRAKRQSKVIENQKKNEIYSKKSSINFR